MPSASTFSRLPSLVCFSASKRPDTLHTHMSLNSFGTRTSLAVGSESVDIYSLPALERRFPGVARLPFSLKILLENLLRREDNAFVHAADIEALAGWTPGAAADKE